MNFWPFKKASFANAAPALYAPNMLPVEGSTLEQSRNNMNYFFTHIGEEPLQVICPNCKAPILTEVDYKTGAMTCLMSCCLCLIGGWCGCYLIPYFMKRFKDVQHYCPNCLEVIGTKKLLGNA